jgi:hypothetical protein
MEERNPQGETVAPIYCSSLRESERVDHHVADPYGRIVVLAAGVH